MPSREQIAASIEKTLCEGMARLSEHDAEHIEVARELWQAYVQATHPTRLKKPKTHAAAIHYATSKLLGLGLTQRTIASIYRVSSGGVSRTYRRIWQRLDLDAGLAAARADATTAHALAGARRPLDALELRTALEGMLAQEDREGLAVLWREHAPECVAHGRPEALDEIATLLLGCHPELSVEILEERIGALIDRGSRSHYRQAAILLELLERAYGAANMEAALADYLEMIEEEASGRPALGEELAGLLARST